MYTKKYIGLVAHDMLKEDMVEWVESNKETLCKHSLVCTGTTGRLIKEMFEKHMPDKKVDITLLKSGPLGGDQQMGSLISNDGIDILIFFADPMTPQPHDVDVKALVRIATIYNIVMACDISTADFIISSPYFNANYQPKRHDYSSYINRNMEKFKDV